MKKFKTDLIIISFLLLVTTGIWCATMVNNAIDIQLHDTYFVFDKSLLIGLVVGPLGFLIFLGRAIAQKFKNISTNAFLGIELVIVALITYYIIQVQENYVNEILVLEDIDASVREKVVDNTRVGIAWSWVLFGIWCVALLVLSFRTVRIPCAEHQRD